MTSTILAETHLAETKRILEDHPAPGTGPVEVSVVMPCLNEARTVGVCVTKAVSALRAMGVRGEVVVADNGSTDGSQLIAEEHGARVVAVQEKGYGAALQGGIAAARGRYVIMGDSDDSYDFTHLDAFVERLRLGDELVMGNRFKGGIRSGAMPWHHRYVGNPVLTGLLNLFYRAGIGDAHCGLRAFRKDAYERLGLRTSGMEFASEMVVKAALKGLRIAEVPVALYPDGRDRPPHLRSFRDGWRHLRFLLLMCPFWLFLVPAVVLLLTGFGLIAWHGSVSPSWAGVNIPSLLLGALCVLLGYQTLWLGLYGKVYGEQAGLLPADPLAARVAAWLTVERGLVFGAVLFAAGVGITLLLVSGWLSVSLGTSDTHQHVLHAILGLAGMALGVQTGYGALFLGVMKQGRPVASATR